MLINFNIAGEQIARVLKTMTLANLKTVDVVAIGDSFTEGMGVSKNETYPGILNKKGF